MKIRLACILFSVFLVLAAVTPSFAGWFYPADMYVSEVDVTAAIPAIKVTWNSGANGFRFTVDSTLSDANINRILSVALTAMATDKKVYIYNTGTKISGIRILK